jgi:diguanylate cyclase (GGDEF)-like protein/PAS domain S-box-containing protein
MAAAQRRTLMNPETLPTDGPEEDDAPRPPALEVHGRVPAQHAGGVEGARKAFHAARAQESRMAFLAKASMILGSTLDSVATIDNVARLAVPDLADICIIDLAAGHATPRRAAVVHADSSREPQLRRLHGQVGLAPDSPQAKTLASGQAQIGRMDAGEPNPWPESSAEAELMRAMEVQAYLILPLRSRGQTIAVMSLLSAARGTYAAEDFATAGEYARRAAVALDNALLYESAVRARAAAEAAQQQFQLLVNDLRESEDKYRTLFEESRDAIYITELDGRFIDVNPAMLELFGYSRSEMLTLNAMELYANGEDRAAFRQVLDAQNSVREYELELRRKDGETLTCLLSSMVRRVPNGQIIGYQGIIHDITQRKRAESLLMESEHFTRAIIASVQQGIIVYDRELRYQVWNRFMEDLSGLPAARVLGTTPAELFPQLKDQGIDALLARALAGETVQSPDLEITPPSGGRTVWTSCVFSPHVTRTGEIMGVVGIVHDITDRKEAEEQLVHNAFHDALTGLPNRALFLDRLERLLKHSMRRSDHIFGVAFMDLDRFKVVNDSLGHLRGDELLVAIARRLERCVRQGDTVASLGGDEFAVLLGSVNDVRDATRVADRILSELSQPFDLAGHEVFTAASIGIALSVGGYESPEEILRDADTAMYRAKLEGRCRYEVFDRNMHERAVQTLQVETDMRRALERREFRAHYQPIIDLTTGRISGLEALLRWEHPTRGMIAPAEFVPLAEETGLIVSIGWWILEDACRQMKRWLDEIPECAGRYVSVNLSSRQFMQPDLLQQVDYALSRTALSPHALRLEITESVVVQHQEAVAASLAALRARGIQLCIDDFGTGYSSLSYMHAFPVSVLKIDRSFISQIGVTGGNPRLVETIVALSRNLGMETVAEGVETQEQLDYLRGLGRLYAQGYYFSKALSPSRVTELLHVNPIW